MSIIVADCGFQNSLSATDFVMRTPFNPHLSTSKGGFFQLISKQGFKKSSEIALLSTVLKRCSFSPTGSALQRKLSVFIPATVVVEARQGPSFIYIPLSSCRRAFSRQVELQVSPDSRQQCYGVNKYLNEGSHSASPLNPQNTPQVHLAS